MEGRGKGRKKWGVGAGVGGKSCELGASSLKLRAVGIKLQSASFSVGDFKNGLFLGDCSGLFIHVIPLILVPEKQKTTQTIVFQILLPTIDLCHLFCLQKSFGTIEKTS